MWINNITKYCWIIKFETEEIGRTKEFTLFEMDNPMIEEEKENIRLNCGIPYQKLTVELFRLKKY